MSIRFVATMPPSNGNRAKKAWRNDSGSKPELSRRLEMSTGQKIEIESVTSPGRVTRVDADKYEAMKQGLLKILPTTSPGLTAAEALEGVKAHLPEELFPLGDKAGWWMKGVQLDLEAKGVIAREMTKPLRWHKL